MKDRDFDNLRRDFIVDQKKNKKVEECLKEGIVKEFIKAGDIEKPKVLDDIEIISRLLKEHNFRSSFDITYTMGLFYVTDEDNIFENHRLINKKEADELNKVINNRHKNEFITYELYDPFNGLVYYSDSPEGLILPSQEKEVEKIDSYNKSNELKNLYWKKLSIAKYQMFLMLMKTRYEDVVKYYNDQNNFKKIESNVDRYIKKLERRQ